MWAVNADGSGLERLTDTPGIVLGYCFTDGGTLVYTAAPVKGLPVGCYDDQLFVGEQRIDLDVNVGKHILADTVDPIAGGSTPMARGEDVWVQLSDKGAVSVARVRDGSVEPVLTGNRVIGEFDVAGEVLVFTHTDPGEAQTIRVASIGDTDERVLHDPNPWLSELTLSECREIWVNVDGVDSQAWAFLPPGGVGDTPPPALMSCHGGPHGAYGWAFNVLLQLNAAKGWTVIMGNPPGSLSYGEKFTQLTHSAWGEADFPHVMAYIDHAIDAGVGGPRPPRHLRRELRRLPDTVEHRPDRQVQGRCLSARRRQPRDGVQLERVRLAADARLLRVPPLRGSRSCSGGCHRSPTSSR